MSAALRVAGAASASQVTSRQMAETRSAVERIAAFTVAARPERFTPDLRHLFKRNILDRVAAR
jgi:hypothetical protein